MKAKYRYPLWLLVPFSLLVILLGRGAIVRLNKPIDVVGIEIDAINRGQIKVATNCFTDDAEVVTSFGQMNGKEEIRDFILSRIRIGQHYQIVGLTADGAIVTGTITETNASSVKQFGRSNPIPVDLKAIIEHGKIVYWETENRIWR